MVPRERLVEKSTDRQTHQKSIGRVFFLLYVSRVPLTSTVLNMVSRKKQRKAGQQDEIAAAEQSRPSSEEWFSRVVEAATAYHSNHFTKL